MLCYVRERERVRREEGVLRKVLACGQVAPPGALACKTLRQQPAALLLAAPPLAWLFLVVRGMPALPRSRPGLASLPFIGSDLDKRDKNRMLT